MQPPEPLNFGIHRRSSLSEERLRVRAGFHRQQGPNSCSHSGIQETIEEHRELPVNLHLVIEGEEEIEVRTSALSKSKSRGPEM
jgi:hypothetical protein